MTRHNTGFLLVLEINPKKDGNSGRLAPLSANIQPVECMVIDKLELVELEEDNGSCCLGSIDRNEIIKDIYNCDLCHIRW